MANPEWGTKRICQSCAAKFYDLKREPIICPKCQTEFDPEAFLKTRRNRTVAGADKEVVGPAAIDPDVEVDDVEVVEDEDEAVAAVVGEDEEEEDLIEDASELGEDEDDMAEVIENVDEEDDR